VLDLLLWKGGGLYTGRLASVIEISRVKGAATLPRCHVLTKATVIFADNQGVIKLANNPVFQKRTKHIAVKYHYTRDLIKQGEIELEYQSIAEMKADELIKSLGLILFNKFAVALDMISVNQTIISVSKQSSDSQMGQNK
jgi:hypothetical protein